MVQPFLVVAAADLRSEFRRPEGLSRFLMLVAAGSILLSAGMGLGPAAQESFPALLWLLLLFAAFLALPASGEPAAVEGLLASGLSPRSILAGKTLSSALLLALGGVVLLGLLLFFFGGSGSLPGALGLLLLGTTALAVASTPIALLLMRSRARGGLLPLLAAPLLLPLLLASVAGLRKGLLGPVPVPEVLFILLYTGAVGLLAQQIAGHVLEVE